MSTNEDRYRNRMSKEIQKDKLARKYGYENRAGDDLVDYGPKDLEVEKDSQEENEARIISGVKTKLEQLGNVIDTNDYTLIMNKICQYRSEVMHQRFEERNRQEEKEADSIISEGLDKILIVARNFPENEGMILKLLGDDYGILRNKEFDKFTTKGIELLLDSKSIETVKAAAKLQREHLVNQTGEVFKEKEKLQRENTRLAADLESLKNVREKLA